MFLDKLNGLLRPKPKYIQVTPPAFTGEPDPTEPPSVMPRHVAIIMDGNGRWANSRNLPRSAGHAAGVETTREIIQASDDWGIEAISLYAFSTENWSRSKEEVNTLMSLLLRSFQSKIDEMDRKNARITILGDIDRMPPQLRKELVHDMERTRGNTGIKLNIALNYGGRAELTRAARRLAQMVSDGEIAVDDIDEDLFASQLYTADSPDVDLLIRTSGELRTSNFLPWQLAYAEMVFDDVYWPDFDRTHYLRCLHEYARRNRRFGGAEDAVKSSDADSVSQ